MKYKNDWVERDKFTADTELKIEGTVEEILKFRLCMMDMDRAVMSLQEDDEHVNILLTKRKLRKIQKWCKWARKQIKEQ